MFGIALVGPCHTVSRRCPGGCLSVVVHISYGIIIRSVWSVDSHGRASSESVEFALLMLPVFFSSPVNQQHSAVLAPAVVLTFQCTALTVLLPIKAFTLGYMSQTRDMARYQVAFFSISRHIT